MQVAKSRSLISLTHLAHPSRSPAMKPLQQLFMQPFSLSGGAACAATFLSLAALSVTTLSYSTVAQAQSTAPDLAPETDLAPESDPLPETTISPTQEYSEYMRLGYAAYQAEDFAEAASFFRAALYAVPNDRDATIAYWNSRAELQDYDLSDRAIEYENNMQLGYDATDEGDYKTALDYFQAALAVRPSDYYAAQAVRNIYTYLNRGVGADSATDVPGMYQVYAGERPYDRYMRLGYAAVQRQYYAAAQTYFRSALYERNNDRQANIAYWNAVDAVRDGEFGTNSEAPEAPYDRYMRLGYDATERGNYTQALGFFENALAERPDDAYALQAIRNVQAYMSPE